MTSNNSGKTSASGTAGIFMIFIACIIALIATIGWIMKISESSNVFLFASATITVGAGLLGYRKSMDKGITLES